MAIESSPTGCDFNFVFASGFQTADLIENSAKFQITPDVSKVELFYREDTMLCHVSVFNKEGQKLFVSAFTGFEVAQSVTVDWEKGERILGIQHGATLLENARLLLGSI